MALVQIVKYHVLPITEDVNTSEKTQACNRKPDNNNQNNNENQQISKKAPLIQVNQPKYRFKHYNKRRRGTNAYNPTNIKQNQQKQKWELDQN